MGGVLSLCMDREICPYIAIYMHVRGTLAPLVQHVQCLKCNMYCNSIVSSSSVVQKRAHNIHT